MSLQGTLETIPLPDVLALLAATKKTGELRITGERGEGRLWLDAGRVVAADVQRASTPVDAVFELLRLSAGSFAFGSGTPAGTPGEPVAVDVLLAEAQERLSAWQAIEAVVPSMACTLRLTPELGRDSVTVSARQWKELVAVAGGGDVNGAMKGLGTGEFEACRIVKELVDAGLVQVGQAPAAPAPPRSAPPRSDQPADQPAPSDQPASSDARTAARAERPRGAEAPAPARRPAPTVRPAPSPGPAAAAAPAPGRAPATAAPVAAASGGRSAAPRRGADPVPDREEAEELVQQLAALGKAHAKAGPAQPEEGPAPAGAHAAKEPAAAANPDRRDAEGDEGDGEGPINRGMLLKFLSSVRP